MCVHSMHGTGIGHRLHCDTIYISFGHPWGHVLISETSLFVIIEVVLATYNYVRGFRRPTYRGCTCRIVMIIILNPFTNTQNIITTLTLSILVVFHHLSSPLPPPPLPLPSGTYFYITAPTLPITVYALRFPSSQYVCSLSFYFSTSGPIDVDVLRENIDINTVYSSSGIGSTETTHWEPISFSYNTTIDSNWGAIAVEVSEYDLGEAVRESTGEELFLGLDGLNLTFCLPCDFDRLPEADNLALTAPPSVNVTLGFVAEVALEGVSVLCPDVPLVFEIETGLRQSVCMILYNNTNACELPYNIIPETRFFSGYLLLWPPGPITTKNIGGFLTYSKGNA